MTPRKRICCADEALLIGKVCMYKLLRTVCNASSLQMNSENKKKTKDMGDHTGCCCAEFFSRPGQTNFRGLVFLGSLLRFYFGCGVVWHSRRRALEKCELRQAVIFWRQNGCFKIVFQVSIG